MPSPPTICPWILTSRLSVGLVVFLSVVVWSAAISAPTAAAITSTDAIARINAVRTANGIPSVVEDPALSAACEAHSRYASLNGGFDDGAPHDETPGRPGYTPEGADAARHSVLAQGRGWDDPHPWATAPFHQAQVLHPRLMHTGYGEHAGYACLQTLTDPDRPFGEQIYTVPGPGATGVPPSEVAMELDSHGRVHVPGDAAGLPAGTETGPNLIVYADDHPTSVEFGPATLTGPSGPVAVASVNGFIIPRRPLAPLSRYRAEIDVRRPEYPCTQEGTPWALEDEQVRCPPSYPSWCQAFVTPVWLPVARPGQGEPTPPEGPPPAGRVCEPGETPLDWEMLLLPERTVTHRWEFTTGPGERGHSEESPSASRRCRATLTAPRRVGRRETIVVRFRTCAAAKVTAAVYRLHSRTQGDEPLSAKSASVRSATRSTLRLSIGRLRPGRYRLNATVRGRTTTTPLTQTVTITGS